MHAFRYFASTALASLALASAPLAATPLTAQSVTATFSEPIYELGDTIKLTITGDPGAWVCVLVDTSTGSITLPGLISFDLAYTQNMSVLDLGPLPPSGNLVLTLPTDCTNAGMTEGPLYVQVAMFPVANPLPAITSEVTALLVGNGDCDVCPLAATQDPLVSALPGGSALFLPGLGGEFVFESQAELTELKNGTASLRGVLRSTANPQNRFILQARLSGRANQATPPAGSPKKKLLPTAFIENGGPIDTDNWHYYTDLSGDLVGLGGLEGALVTLSDFGGATQLGLGANGKNLGYGVCAGLETHVDAQPNIGATLTGSQAGELTLEIGNCATLTADLCVGPSLPTGHVLWWPEVSKFFMPLDDKITFEEFADGTAHLFGTVAVQGEPEKCFELDVRFSGRLDFGDAAFPPAGSPKWGNVDPASADEDTWHYYENTEGVMRGCGDFDGARIALEGKGPAFQVGVGANFHDLDSGGSGWVYMNVLRQPTSGTTFSISTNGDINLDFIDCPAPKSMPLVHYDFSGQAGDHVIDQAGDFDLVFDANDGQIDWVSYGGKTGVRLTQGSKNKTSVRRQNGVSNSSLLNALSVENAMTVQVYFRQDATEIEDSRLVTFSSSTSLSDRNFTLMTNAESEHMEGQVRLSTAAGTLDEDYDASWKAGELTAIAMTYGKDGVVRIFQNGVLVESYSHGGNFANWQDRDFLLGNESGGKRPFYGEIFDVKIWNRALSTAEVAKEAASL